MLTASQADLPELGRAIQEAREARNLTRNKLATFAGITGPYIHGLERGRVTGAPSVPYLRAIADALYLNPKDAVVERYELRVKLLRFAGHTFDAQLDEHVVNLLRQEDEQEDEQEQRAKYLAEAISRLPPADLALVGGLVERLRPASPNGAG